VGKREGAVSEEAQLGGRTRKGLAGGGGLVLERKGPVSEFEWRGTVVLKKKGDFRLKSDCFAFF